MNSERNPPDTAIPSAMRNPARRCAETVERSIDAGRYGEVNARILPVEGDQKRERSEKRELATSWVMASVGVLHVVIGAGNRSGNCLRLHLPLLPPVRSRA